MLKKGLDFISIAATAFRLTDGDAFQQFHQYRLYTVRSLVLVSYHDLTGEIQCLTVIVFQFYMEESTTLGSTVTAPLVDVFSVRTALMADCICAFLAHGRHITHLHSFFKRNVEGFLCICNEQYSVSWKSVRVISQLRRNDKTETVKQADLPIRL
jgi:hypothetical protein